MNNGTVKIGVSKNLLQRMQSISYATGLKILRNYHTDFAPAEIARIIETSCHIKFEYGRVYGEYFNISFDEACNELASYRKKIEVANEKSNEDYQKAVNRAWEIFKALEDNYFNRPARVNNQNEGTLKAIEGIKRVEWSNQPVLTTAQLAKFYGCKIENIRDNFHNHREHFVEGKHFFKLKGDELEKVRREHRGIFNVSPQYYINSLYLWTKQGIACHAKMLNTDKAWEVFEALEDNYFNRPTAKQSDFLATFADFVTLERERIVHDRDKFNFEREHARDNFAKAQLLRELASASGHNQTLRDNLIRNAAELVTGKSFANKIYYVGDEV